MTRPLRIAYPGALYHLTSRGNQKKTIFKNDKDRYRFLRILEDVVRRYRWICYAYCLMDNHYHLLIETPLSNISVGMRHLNGLYTAAFNRRHHTVGHILQGRFKGIVVQKEAHWLELCRYIVLNPVRAGICHFPEEYRWSSYRATVGLDSCPAFLTMAPLLRSFGEDPLSALTAYQQFVREGINSSYHPWDQLKGEIFLGDDAFIQKLQDQNVDHPEISRTQLEPLRPALTVLLKEPKGMLTAHQQFGYRLHEIAAFKGVHYSTISRRIKQLERQEKLLISEEIGEAINEPKNKHDFDTAVQDLTLRRF